MLFLQWGRIGQIMEETLARRISEDSLEPATTLDEKIERLHRFFLKDSPVDHPFAQAAALVLLEETQGLTRDVALVFPEGEAELAKEVTDPLQELPRGHVYQTQNTGVYIAGSMAQQLNSNGVIMVFADSNFDGVDDIVERFQAAHKIPFDKADIERRGSQIRMKFMSKEPVAHVMNQLRFIYGKHAIGDCSISTTADDTPNVVNINVSEANKAQIPSIEATIGRLVRDFVDTQQRIRERQGQPVGDSELSDLRDAIGSVTFQVKRNPAP